MFDETEKKILKNIVKKELEKLEETEEGVIDASPVQLKAEQKYNDVLKSILKKL